ncbi:MT-A70-domain-containing protein [Echria macrotheca]|uniref:MT-A70-domain-containing protein n=1 Tax=Echria macrotheca TaxID=438768 RepID=A0AAJ0F9U2_9PEZI|nr:MT-A70-domain-containing protein [Echria macrotheca]
MTSSSILFQNASKTVVLLDLPRTIEEAQMLSSDLRNNADPSRRLVSVEAPILSFATPEPKASRASSAPPAAQVADLMTAAAAESALAEITTSRPGGPWHLPRITSHAPLSPAPTDNSTPDSFYRPPDSHYLHGSIASQRDTLLASVTPSFFDLILLDPPWPNRSAKRKRGAYHPVPDFSSLSDLLSLVPVASHLAPGGLVAVWVTNSPRAVETLTAPRDGIFARWDVELVGEWTWLKVTAAGEPIIALDATWRRPWERLLIARKRGGSGGCLPGKVIVSVPDVHSRKPCLRSLFEELLPDKYEALEVFARSLTAGWWSWGDEVSLFQAREHWVERRDEADPVIAAHTDDNDT